MYKKTIEYTDEEGNLQEEEFNFHLTKAEITELEYSYGGGLTAVIERLSRKQEIGKVIEIIKSVVLKAYGEKVTDRTGKERFIKTKDASDIFAATEAYSELFMGFVENPDAFNEFLIGIMPIDMQADVKKAMKEQGKLQKNNPAPPEALK